MALLCQVSSGQGIKTALALKKLLDSQPWHGEGELEIHASRKLLQRHDYQEINPYDNLREFVAVNWLAAKGFIFIGAIGISVRAVAPCLVHKSIDPPVVALDQNGQYAISLLSGHLGGANDLAAHVASLLHATPIITTASDLCQAPALDLLCQKAGLKILDWNMLPAMQGKLLEEQKIYLYDPYAILPPHAQLIPATDAQDAAIAIGWRKQEPEAGLLRIALSIIHIGIGCRKGAAPDLVEQYYQELLASCGIEPQSVAAIATVAEKAAEPAIEALVQAHNLPLRFFPAQELAQYETPNPSKACGARFATAPFSVCESAALASANASGQGVLLQEKIKFASSITFAIALSKPANATTKD